MNLLGLVGTKPIVVPRFCTWERMFFVVWRLRKWTCEKKLVLERVWLAFERSQVTIVEKTWIRAFSRLKWSWERGTLLFVFLACLQSGTGKIPENISKFARRQFSRDRSFTKDLAGKLRVWFKFASGKSQKLTSKFHTFGNGCVAMLNYQRILYMCHNYGVYSPNMLNNGSVRSVSDQT